MAAINNDWLDALKGEFKKPYYKELFQKVNQEYRTHRIYPPADDIFNAFHLTPLKDVKVVILGQDPYHEPGQAHGLSFSVPADQILHSIHFRWCVSAHCARPSGQFSPGNRMGRIYRCGDSGVECAG